MRHSLLLALLLLPASVEAGPYLGLGLGGTAGTADAFHFTSTFGFASRNPNAYDGLFGAEVSVMFNNDDDQPDDINDYEIPHWDYNTVGTFQLGPEVSLGLKLGVELVPNSGLLLTACGGTSVRQRTEVVQSNATGWYYENGTTESTLPYYGVGLVYQPDASNWAFYAQFDRRRGAELGYQLDL